MAPASLGTRMGQPRELCPSSVPSPSPAAGWLHIPESSFHPPLHLLLLGIAKTGRTGLPGSHRLPGDYRAAECPSEPGPGAVRTLAFALCPCLFSLLLLHKGTNHHKKLHVLETLPLGHCLFPTRCLEGRATPAGNGIFDRVHTDNSKDASLQEEKQN